MVADAGDSRRLNTAIVNSLKQDFAWDGPAGERAAARCGYANDRAAWNGCKKWLRGAGGGLDAVRAQLVSGEYWPRTEQLVGSGLQ